MTIRHIAPDHSTVHAEYANAGISSLANGDNSNGERLTDGEGVRAGIETHRIASDLSR